MRSSWSGPGGDLIICAVAEHYAATVMHYDKDFDLIAKVSRVDFQWVVRKGSVP